jgi:signal transduction histidine kinase
LQEKQLNLVWNVSPDLPPVKGDSGRLKQAFTNLLDNAVKYSKAGGNIGVRTELQDEQLLIEISDTGIGISLEEQHFIFDRFFRSELISEDYEGTGLGLSIVKSVVAQHQGRIWVTSALGAGATFTVVLPPFIED